MNICLKINPSPLALKAARAQVISLFATDWSVTVDNTEQIIWDGCCLSNCSGTSGTNEWKYWIAS